MMKRLIVLLLLSMSAHAADKTALNTGYAHYADIVFAAGFAEASGDFRELVTDTLIGVPGSGVTRGTDVTYEEYAACTSTIGDAIDFGDNDAWDGKAAMTVAALVRNNQSTTNSNQYIISKTGGGSDSYASLWQVSENVLSFIYISSSSVGNSITNGLDNIPTVALATEWNVIGFTYDGADMITRVNTTKSTAATTSGSVDATAHSLVVCGDSSSGSSSWDGDIAGAVIMDVALDDTDWNSLVADPLQIYAADGGSPSGLLRRRRSN